MSIKILMPALSPTMSEGNINKWLVKVGDKVKPGDIIAEIETDKATMELEAVDEGIITHMIDHNSNKAIPVNKVIAIIGGSKDDSIESNDIKPLNQEIISKSESSKLKFNKEISIKTNHLEEKTTLASHFAKYYSKKNNINISEIKGTGPKGRIIKRDVINLKSREEQNQILRDYKIIEPSNIRTIIAKRTTETKQTIPHYYLTIESNVDKLILLRNKINNENNFKISFNDIFVKALALALKKNPNTNVSWINNKIYKYSTVDVSIAVALKEGLITPIVKDADKKSLSEISLEIKELVIKAKENKLQPEEYIGGSISISNLGMYGVSEFSAIINPPQSSILAIGKIKKTPIVNDKNIEIGNLLKSTLSADHRVLDGAVAGKLVKDFNDIIQNPIEIWIESNDLNII